MWVIRSIRRYICFTRTYIYRVTLLRIVSQVFSLITHCARILAFFALCAFNEKAKPCVQANWQIPYRNVVSVCDSVYMYYMHIYSACKCNNIFNSGCCFLLFSNFTKSTILYYAV